MADRYRDLIAEMQRIGWRPDRERLAAIGAELIELAHQVEIGDAAGRERDQLDELRTTAHALLSDARHHYQIELATTRAARERELHDRMYPTQLSPQRDFPERGFTRDR
ncbi:hypothetical protein ACFVMC_32850 [Nocardia sp. NPDC127579]|uniref:hypothetical protein n=1 Tax=Nocardia sp. NPDC127579 TaxID=3345402 RepID=UPI003641C7C8